MEQLKNKMYRESLESCGVSLSELDEALSKGNFICPTCFIEYTPRHNSKQKAFETDDAESREQWLSHICSDKCWDKIFGGS